MHNIYLYTTGTIFCKYVFLFCATLNIFSQHESSFGCHIISLLPQHFFVTHIILVRNANFYSKYFFVDKAVFCGTQHFFVLPNMSLKNIVNKEKQMCSLFSTFWLDFVALEGVYTWNHPCLWWNVSYCLHVFAEMKFHPGMNSSLPKRQGWKKDV